MNTLIAQTGSGGLGAVSIGVSEWVVGAVVIVLLIGLWKLAKFLLVMLQ